MEPLRRQSRVLVSEDVPLPRSTVQALVETIEAIFSRKDKPTRLLYVKGQDLAIETPTLATPTELEGLESGLFTPYQFIRQHCEIAILDPENTPLLTACVAAVRARKAAAILSGIVVSLPETLEDWIPGVPLDEVFGVPVYVDPEVPDGVVFFCSSSAGTLIRDFEQAVACHTSRS
jgi:hypothetical protein